MNLPLAPGREFQPSRGCGHSPGPPARQEPAFRGLILSKLFGERPRQRNEARPRPGPASGLRSVRLNKHCPSRPGRERVCAHTPVHVCVCAHVCGLCMCVPVCLCMSARVHLCVHVCLCAHECMCAHVCTFVCNCLCATARLDEGTASPAPGGGRAREPACVRSHAPPSGSLVLARRALSHSTDSTAASGRHAGRGTLGGPTTSASARDVRSARDVTQSHRFSRRGHASFPAREPLCPDLPPHHRRGTLSEGSHGGPAEAASKGPLHRPSRPHGAAPLCSLGTKATQ